MESIRVVAYNVHWGIGMDGRLDLARVGDAIRRLDPDVVGIQEVDRTRRPETEYADQFAELRDRLGWDGTYGKTIEEEPTANSGGESRRYGIATLTPHEVVRSENHPLPTADGAEPRTLLETRIGVDGREFPVFNTHFGLDPEERHRQATDVLDITDGNDGAVLVGDLNAKPGSPPYERLTSSFTDGVATSNAAAPTFPSPYVEPDGRKAPGSHTAYVPDRRIDHVLHGPGIESRDARVVHSLASDHSPVVVDLVVGGGR